MKRLGTVGPDAELSPINPWPAPEVVAPIDLVLPWDSLSGDQRRLFTRMAEVYAGFSSHMDQDLGRLVGYLEASGQLDNTIVVVCSDNGASGEGSPNGSVNENKFFNAWPDDLQQNLRLLDALGSPRTYNHSPPGWAWAFNVWWVEAGRNGVLPLDDRSAIERLLDERPTISGPRTSYTYYPNTSGVPESAAADIRNKSFTILAKVEVETPEAEGVILAMGSRHGGHSVFVKDRRLH